MRARARVRVCVFVCVCGSEVALKILLAEMINTVKVLNFRTPENFAVIYLKFKQRGKEAKP